MYPFWRHLKKGFIPFIVLSIALSFVLLIHGANTIHTGNVMDRNDDIDRGIMYAWASLFIMVPLVLLFVAVMDHIRRFSNTANLELSSIRRILAYIVSGPWKFCQGSGNKNSCGSSGSSVDGSMDAQKDKDIPTGQFIWDTVTNFSLLIASVLPSYVMIRYLVRINPRLWGDVHLFYGLQFIETKIVYGISRLLNFPVKLTGDPVILQYPDPPLGRIWIAPDCTGIMEIVFIMALVLGFCFGPTLKTRLKWGLGLVGILFVENIIRLVLNWPLAKAYGFAGWEQIHIFWWKTGQLLFIILLFFIFFFTWHVQQHKKSSDPKQQG